MLLIAMYDFYSVIIATNRLNNIICDMIGYGDAWVATLEVELAIVKATLMVRDA